MRSGPVLVIEMVPVLETRIMTKSCLTWNIDRAKAEKQGSVIEAKGTSCPTDGALRLCLEGVNYSLLAHRGDLSTFSQQFWSEESSPRSQSERRVAI